jgi:hypothetical protein
MSIAPPPFACVNVDFRNPAAPTMAVKQNGGELEVFADPAAYVTRLGALVESGVALVSYNGVSYVFEPLHKVLCKSEHGSAVKTLALGHCDIMVAFFAEHGKTPQRRRFGLPLKSGGYWWPCDHPKKLDHASVIDEIESLALAAKTQYHLTYRPARTGSDADLPVWTPSAPGYHCPWFSTVSESMATWQAIPKAQRPNAWMSPGFKRDIETLVPICFQVGEPPNRPPPSPPE